MRYVDELRGYEREILFSPENLYDTGGGIELTNCVVEAKEDDWHGRAPVPWFPTESISVTPGTVLSISAQNKQNWGRITVRIVQNKRVLKEATSEGAYVIASTSIRIE
jgi:hypothetical protein